MNSISPTDSSPLRAGAVEIVRRLQDNGHEALWVGGCVRDSLLGKIPKDYDIATSARPDGVQRLFPRTRAVGRQFGVILVIVGDAHYEVATFRAESEYTDGRRPGRVTFANAQADAQRRDFTINGLFYDPVSEVLHDWIGGEGDLRTHCIRTIGRAAERFAEDHLRLLRAVRFAAQLGFDIAPDTLTAIQENAHLIRLISAERIRDELIKSFQPPHAARGLDLLRASGLLSEVLPEVAATIACDQSSEYHPEGSVYNHIRIMLECLPSDAHLDLPWAVLLHDIAKPVTATRSEDGKRINFYGHERIGEEMTRRILTHLRFPRDRIEDIAACVRLHMQFKDVPNMRRATVRRMLMRPTFPLELALHRLDCVGSHGQLDIHSYLCQQAKELESKPALLPPLLTGDDLIALGFRPGPALGELLARIREKQLQEELTNKGEALHWARRFVPSSPSSSATS